MIKGLQKYQWSKLEIEKNLPDQPGPRRISLESGWISNFLTTSNFELWYFCSLLTYKDMQYLIWKIWFISVWRLKARGIVWLLTWFVFTQSTLSISYHTEACVKTEVGGTVHTHFWCSSFCRLSKVRWVKVRNFEQKLHFLLKIVAPHTPPNQIRLDLFSCHCDLLQNMVSGRPHVRKTAPVPLWNAATTRYGYI